MLEFQSEGYTKQGHQGQQCKVHEFKLTTSLLEAAPTEFARWILSDSFSRLSTGLFRDGDSVVHLGCNQALCLPVPMVGECSPHRLPVQKPVQKRCERICQQLNQSYANNFSFATLGGRGQAACKHVQIHATPRVHMFHVLSLLPS